MKFCLRIISYLVKLLLLLGILFNINISFATDYVISANQSDQIVMVNNDTLTVQSGVTVNTSADDSVEFEGHSFSTSDTVVTNAGTIIRTVETPILLKAFNSLLDDNLLYASKVAISMAIGKEITRKLGKRSIKTCNAM